jgi:hypothetical protein
MIWLLLPPPFLVRKLDRRKTGRLRKRKLADRRGGGGAKSYDSEKALSSKNQEPPTFYCNSLEYLLTIQERNRKF